MPVEANELLEEVKATFSVKWKASLTFKKLCDILSMESKLAIKEV